MDKGAELLSKSFLMNTSSQLSLKKEKKNRHEIDDVERLTIFYRDGFIDRYTGRRLIFPALCY